MCAGRSTRLGACRTLQHGRMFARQRAKEGTPQKEYLSGAPEILVTLHMDSITTAPAWSFPTKPSMFYAPPPPRSPRPRPGRRSSGRRRPPAQRPRTLSEAGLGFAYISAWLVSWLPKCLEPITDPKFADQNPTARLQDVPSRCGQRRPPQQRRR